MNLIINQNKEENIYHVACCTDNNYIYHCCSMFCSLLENNKNIFINIHLIFENLTENNQDIINKLVNRYYSTIEFHRIVTDKLEHVKFRAHNPLSKAAYYRLLLSSLLPNLDKVLYLDIDMIVLGSIKPLFDLEIESYALAAVKDVEDCTDEHRMQLSLPISSLYFCSALMIVNLDFWRQHNSEKKLLQFANRKRKVFCHDQDCLNYVFKNSWFELPPKWNKFHMTYIAKRDFVNFIDRYEYKKKPIIIHFSGYNPKRKCFFIRYEKIYLKYLNLSEYKIVKVKTTFWLKFRPIIRYHFIRVLKIINIYDVYIYWKLNKDTK
jgi:lipopolysaccharide biosynthesis glycosyltransferase